MNKLVVTHKPWHSREMGRRFITAMSILLVLLMTWQWGSALWIFAKAHLAQYLIVSAWDEMRFNKMSAVKPWPWADTHPLARLHMTRQGVDLVILAGAQGNSLAFGPGHMQGTALPGEGISVIGGHRDTHFRFLKDINLGDHLTLETLDGRRLLYQVEHIDIVDSRSTPLVLEDDSLTGLVLVTCYPFEGIDPDGPLRMVVRAAEVTAPAITAQLDRIFHL